MSTSGQMIENKRRVLTRRASDEWYTPPHVIDAARQVLGGIDLDPASCAAANKIVQASTFFDQESDGLAQPWFGRVWCNPPFSLIKTFTPRIIDAYEQGEIAEAVYLVRNSTGARWFQPLYQYPRCYVTGRLKFVRPDGRRNTATFDCVLVYLGTRRERFAELFGQLGAIEGLESASRQSQAMPLLTSHQRGEWFTPPHVIDAAWQVLGGIDLDPASCAAANATVQATTFFDQEANGLARDWSGRVWLNPPFGKVRGKSQQAIWTRKLLQEHHAGRVPAAVLLVNDARGYRWFNDLLWRRYPVCLVDDLLAFRRGAGARATPAKQASCLFYLGPEVERFREVCEALGEVIVPSARTGGQLTLHLQ